MLAAAGAGIGVLAGCSGVISSDGGGNESLPVGGEEPSSLDGGNGSLPVGGEEPNGSDGGTEDAPVYGEDPDDPEQRLRLRVTVVEDGVPLAEEPVVYHDHGGSYDTLEGATGEGGELVFVDSMGPPPCNPVEVELPERERVVDVGCHDGAKELAETIDVASGA